MNATPPAMKSRATNRHPRRGGFSLLESIVACTLFGMFCAMITPVVARLGVVQDQLAQRDIALTELRNIAERGIYQPTATAHALSPEVLALLPECEFTQRPVADADFSGMQRMELRISWLPRPGQPREQVALCYWVPMASEVAP